MSIQELYVSRFDQISREIHNLSELFGQLNPTGNLSLSELTNTLPPREKKELCFALVYTITVLYSTLLRCQGTDESKHAILKEYERLKPYLHKLSSNTTETSETNQGSDKVSHRFIQHHLRN